MVRPVTLLSLLVLAGLAAGPVGLTAPGLSASEPFLCPHTGTVPLIDLDPADVPVHLPLSDSCLNLIRPGARQSNGCTLNFVFRDADHLYIGTAGHCTNSVGQRISTAQIGEFGTVVYRLNGGVGSDFALIRIDVDKHGLVEATMCAFGGPSEGSGSTAAGQHVHNYGWGYQTSSTGATRARVGVLSSGGGNSITFEGFGSPGDSGSPVTGVVDQPVGIVTHGLTTFGSPVIFGTSYARMLTLAHGAGFPITLVAGESGGLP
jgi:hypothetical protein